MCLVLSELSNYQAWPWLILGSDENWCFWCDLTVNINCEWRGSENKIFLKWLENIKLFLTKVWLGKRNTGNFKTGESRINRQVSNPFFFFFSHILPVHRLLWLFTNNFFLLSVNCHDLGKIVMWCFSLSSPQFPFCYYLWIAILWKDRDVNSHCLLCRFETSLRVVAT